MKRRLLWVLPIFVAVLSAAGTSAYVSARQKIDLIESHRLKAGARVQMTPEEVKAYAETQLPDGVRNPKLAITAPGVATGSAMVDFAKVRRAQGNPPGWLMSKLLEGERPVSVTARITSSGGMATVDVERVQVSGMEIDGATLDFLIDHVLIPLYPTAAVGRPFELGHRIERLDVRPNAIAIVIGK